MMQWGSIIMILGTIIQVTAFKGHMAGEQFCIGRVSELSSLVPCLVAPDTWP